jgi:hypothetical protein
MGILAWLIVGLIAGFMIRGACCSGRCSKFAVTVARLFLARFSDYEHAMASAIGSGVRKV